MKQAIALKNIQIFRQQPAGELATTITKGSTLIVDDNGGTFVSTKSGNIVLEPSFAKTYQPINLQKGVDFEWEGTESAPKISRKTIFTIGIGLTAIALVATIVHFVKKK
jgi:hypothetical protein